MVQRCTLSTVADRAAQSGASERTQKAADKVAKADPALAVQVAHGEISLPKAVAQVENRPPKSQVCSGRNDDAPSLELDAPPAASRKGYQGRSAAGCTAGGGADW